MNTKELNIKILETAGYTVNLYENTFSIWEDGIKMLGAHKRLLEDKQFSTNYIRNQGYNDGYDEGVIDIKNEFKKLLGV